MMPGGLQCSMCWIPPYVNLFLMNSRALGSFWKVGGYLPMPGGLECSMCLFPPPVNLFLMNSRALNHVVKLVVTCLCQVVYSAVCAGFLHL